MTPRDRARKLSAEWGGNPNVAAVTGAIEQAVEEAVAEAVEMCARLAEAEQDMTVSEDVAFLVNSAVGISKANIAAAIRNRAWHLVEQN